MFSAIFLFLISPNFHRCVGVSSSPSASPDVAQQFLSYTGFASENSKGSSENENVKPLPIDPYNSSDVPDNNDDGELGNIAHTDETIECFEACWNNQTCSNMTLSIQDFCVFYDEMAGAYVCDPLCLEMAQICPVLSDHAKEVRNGVKIWLDGVSKVSKTCNVFVEDPVSFFLILPSILN